MTAIPGPEASLKNPHIFQTVAESWIETMPTIDWAELVQPHGKQHEPSDLISAVRAAMSAVGLSANQGNSGNSAAELSRQWTNPSDVLSVLLIIGGDIVQKAIAQTAGGVFTPVCFSFGWVGYSLLALVGVLGDGHLLPDPDYLVKVFNLGSGYVRENQNWVVGRILRDNTILMEKIRPLGRQAIRISIYEAVKTDMDSSAAGRGSVRFWGISVMLLQLIIAAIPLILYREWGVLLITGSGTVLALLAAALPQWRAEKLPNKRNSNKVFALTSGNGSRDIMIILGNGRCLDLEELSSREMPRSSRFWHSARLLTKPVLKGGEKTYHANGNEVRDAITIWNVPIGFLITIVVTALQVLCWLIVLISVAGLKSHTWFLLLVGALGMFQNAAVAAISRNPSKRNLPLCHVETIMTNKVMDGLMDLEVTYPRTACHLLREFFPGSLLWEEKAWWNGQTGAYDDERKKSPERGFPRSLGPRFRSAVERQTERGDSSSELQMTVGQENTHVDTSIRKQG